MTFKEVIYGRRAVNFFDPEKTVSDSLLTETIEMAAQAPSGFNIQPWSLIVLQDQADKLRLRKHAWTSPRSAKHR